MNQPPNTEGATGPESRPPSTRRPSWSTPRLRVGEEGERRATWLELFFDLVFVVAIAALASFLHDELTPGGFLGFALLLVPVGWAWMSFAYYADQFDTDDTLLRVAMLASAALAVNIAGASQGSSNGFVIANVVLRVLLIGLYAWAWRNAAEARPMSARCAAGFSVGALT